MQRNIRAADMNVIVTRAADGLLRRSFTVAEIRRMVEAGILAEDENFELIDGEVVPTSPKGNQHEVIKSALTEMLISLKSPELRLGVESTLYLDDRTFVEPDLCLYPKRILPEDVNGSDVVLAIEVAASSMGYDRGLKARLYAARHQRVLGRRCRHARYVGAPAPAGRRPVGQHREGGRNYACRTDRPAADRNPHGGPRLTAQTISSRRSASHSQRAPLARYPTIQIGRR
jgi:hypothetical protein